MIILIVFYIVFLVSVLLLTYLEYQKYNYVTAYIFFNISFLLYFIVVPILILIILTIEPMHHEGFFIYLKNLKLVDYYYGFFFSLIFYISFWGFRKLFLTGDKSTVKNKNSQKIFLSNEKKLGDHSYKLGVICLAIGGGSELIIIKDLGGLFEALSKGDVLRSFSVDGATLVPQNHLFLTITMVLTMGATYLLFLSNRIEKSPVKKIFIVLSFIGSLFYLLFNAGRLGVLLFFLCFVLDYAYRKSKHPFLLVVVAGLVSLFLLEKLNEVFFYISYGYIKSSEVNIFIRLINEFMFPYVNILHSLKMNAIFGLRYGLDFITWIVNIIPYSILSIFGLEKLQTSYTFITFYYVGQGSDGGVPTDLITQGIRQFGFIGIMFSSLIMAKICTLLDRLISREFFLNYTFFSLRVLSISFVLLPYADIDSFVKNRMDLLVLLVFLILVRKIEDSQRSTHELCIGLE